MKYAVILLTTAILFNATKSNAQTSDKDYKQRASEIRDEVWDKTNASFQVKEIPATYANESAVIIARSFNVVNSAKLKLKMSLFGMGAAQRISYQTTYHERVKINDKAALDDFSTIEYQKKLDNTFHVAFARMINKTNTFIGAKIIKSSGEEVIVNTDEEVLTKDENSSKAGKLAISNLQTGDILDYYIRIETVKETGSDVQGPYTFVMGGEYPIMHYDAKLQLDDRVGVEYISANGAPAFKESKTDDGDILLELTQNNLPRLESKWWTSIARQYPYISLQYMFVSKQVDAYSHFNRGEVKHGFLSDGLTDQIIQVLKSPYGLADYTPELSTKEYFGGSKKIGDFSQDTIVKVLYNYWRFKTFSRYSAQDVSVTNDDNYSTANSLVSAISMCEMLNDLGIDNEFYLVCSRNGASLKNVMGLGDFSAMIKVYAGNKQYWMAFDDIVTQFNEIPAWFQGEDAITIKPEKDRKTWSFTSGKGKVPVTNASANTITENISVDADPSNMQLLKIDRTAMQTGSLRHSDQKGLMMLEDMDAALSQQVSEKKLVDRLAEDKKTQKLVTEYNAAFAKERTNTKEYFTSEIKNQFGTDPKDVSTYSIKNTCMFNEQIPFIYQSAFTMENFVKKAGNNYILEVGKLVGTYDKPDAKDSIRNIDVYMPCARTYTYNLSIAIPKGFTVKGINDLNKQVTNETGMFICEATADADLVKIKVSRTYNHNFEKAADWPKLLDLINSFYNFTTQKILFEKAK